MSFVEVISQAVNQLKAIHMITGTSIIHSLVENINSFTGLQSGYCVNFLWTAPFNFQTAVYMTI